MSTMAMASSSLNPNAPLFIPAAYRQVEDFSPEWWQLVNTTAWFRDHWFRQQAQHQLHDDEADVDVAALLPDDSVDLLDMVHAEDLFYAPPDSSNYHNQAAKTPAYDVDVLRALSLGPVVAAPSPRAAHQQQQQHYHHQQQQQHGVGAVARRAIHQPR